jgi:hypothetical protein
MPESNERPNEFYIFETYVDQSFPVGMFSETEKEGLALGLLDGYFKILPDLMFVQTYREDSLDATLEIATALLEPHMLILRLEEHRRINESPTFLRREGALSIINSFIDVVTRTGVAIGFRN